MCTVTFLARRNGYCLGMNRDEQRTRVTGLPPVLRKVNGRAVLAPSEPSGGTWIALNDHGATLALINWYSITARVKTNPVSRGEIINAACAADLPTVVDQALANLSLQRINPFRLIGVFPAAGEVVEWRWNLEKLGQQRHRWKSQQWISSGFDEPTAQRIRSRTFRVAQAQTTAGSLGWLRRLHRAHVPNCGPFSICMHRADAATVSYSEVLVSPRVASLRYHSGAPCELVAASVLTLSRAEG